MRPPRPLRILVQIAATTAALLLAQAALSFTEHSWLEPSLGGSCVILFGTPRGIVAQLRSFLGGHVIAKAVGLIFRVLHDVMGGPLDLRLALALGTALAAMAVTRTIHSPAGANPVVVFVLGAEWGFLASPLLPGLATLFLVPFAANNLPLPWGAGPWPRFASRGSLPLRQRGSKP